MNVLFIGNSYTYYNDMPKIFEALATENGIEINVDSVTKGGRSLIENTDPCDENHKKIVDLCKNKRYDVLFLQEQSVLPIKDFDTFLSGVMSLKELVKAKRTILYSTWGRKSGSELLKELKITSSQMTDSLCTAYEKAAKEANCEVSSVGSRFKFISENYPAVELYNADLSHPSPIGSSLAAAVHFITVFGEFPSTTNSLSLDEYESYVINSLKY